MHCFLLKYACQQPYLPYPKTGCPLKISRFEPGQYLDGRPPGKTRLLQKEVLVRPEAHPVVCVGPNAPVKGTLYCQRAPSFG